MGVLPVIILRILMCYCVLEEIFKILKLQKIHLGSDTTESLINKIIEYKKITLLTFKLGIYILAPFLLLIITVSLYNANDYNLFIRGIGAYCIGLLIGIYTYRKHMKNINSVLKSLAELKAYIEEE